MTTKRLTKVEDRAAQKILRTRTDAWVNSASGLGGAYDKAAQTTFIADCIQSEAELEALYRYNGLARVVVSELPKDSMRLPPCLELEDKDEENEAAQDQERDLAAKMREHQAFAKITQARIWGRLFGRGAVVFVIKGGGDHNKPWEPGKGEVTGMFVASGPELRVKTWYDDPMSEKFGTPATFWLTRRGVGVASGQIEVHESRMVLFGGADTTPETKQLQQGADDSVLVATYNELKLAGANYQNVSTMVHDQSVALYKLTGFLDSMSAMGREVLQARFREMDAQRSNNRCVVLDKDGEEFEYKERGTMAGVKEILDTGFLVLAAVARMPVTRLLGQSPAGLNATGESDRAIWYEQCQIEREQVLEAGVLAVAKALAPTKEWKLKWPSLWGETSGEKWDRLVKQAQVDKSYIDAGVLQPEEVAIERFKEGSELEIEIDTEIRESILENDLEAKEESSGSDPLAPLPGQEGIVPPANGAPGEGGAAGAKGAPGEVPPAKPGVAEGVPTRR